MSRFIVIACFILPVCVCGQTNLKEIWKKSHVVFAYKISANAAEKYIRQDSIDIDNYISIIPAAVFPADSVDEKKLSNGHYILLSVDDNRITANLISISDLYIYPINNEQRVQLLLMNRKGDFINNAKIWVNEKEAVYKKDAKSYLVPQKNPEELLIKIYTENDTLRNLLIIQNSPSI